MIRQSTVLIPRSEMEVELEEQFTKKMEEIAKALTDYERDIESINQLCETAKKLLAAPGGWCRDRIGLQKLISMLTYDTFLDSLVVECWLRVREVLGSIPSQGPRHTKDVLKMVPVVPLFSTEHSKGKILALSQEVR